MDEAYRQKLRRVMRESVTQLLNDAELQGNLPEDVCRALRNNPDRLIDSVVSLLMPNVEKLRDGAAPAGGSEAASSAAGGDGASASESAPLEISAEAIKVLMLLPALNKVKLTEEKKILDGALLFCTRGNKMLKVERWKDAKAFFQRAVSIEANLKSAWLGLAEAHEKLGEEADAEKARQRAAALP